MINLLIIKTYCGRILLFFLMSHSILASELIYDEVESDISVPLISRSNFNENEIIDNTNEETSCFNFVELIKKLFRLKNNNPPLRLKVEHENFFPIIPIELIYNIACILDPLSIIQLSQTCIEAQIIFSTSYWEHKCRVEKLTPWSRDISPQKVYIANFWHKTQQLSLLEKSALLGNPESMKTLKTRRNRPHIEKSHFTCNYTEPPSHYLYTKFGGRF
jgi:hypothetical protein